jgi:hypothetical protein
MFALMLGAFLLPTGGSFSHLTAQSTTLSLSGLALFAGIAAALQGAFWAYDGWNKITYIAGEYAICMPALLHDVMEEMHKGTPVGYVKTVPPVVFPRQAAIYAKAPNPNTAKLFAEWLISDEGQKTTDSIGRETSRNDFKSKTSIESAYGKNMKPLPVTDQQFLEDPKSWLDKFVKPVWEG